MKKIKYNSINNKIEVITKQRNTVIDYVRDLRTILTNYELQGIYAMDEVTILYDELGLTNFEFTDIKEGTDSTTNKLNALLTIGADGCLLHGFIVLHREILNVNVPANISLTFTRYADLDHKVFKYYALQILKII